MARRGYPPEFRQRVIELVEGGRKVAEVAAHSLFDLLQYSDMNGTLLTGAEIARLRRE
jgi:hypothetical protein